jgi:hypothetical protein
MTTMREGTGNADICAVLSGLVALEAFASSGPGLDDSTGPTPTVQAPIGPVPAIGRDTLDAFLLDHAHHADRLPRLLDELRTPRAA